MNILHILKQNKDRWWALPLILPVVLLPVLSVANTLTQLGDGIVALYYLPLSFLLALMLLAAGAGLALVLLSYNPADPSFNSATTAHATSSMASGARSAVASRAVGTMPVSR